MKTVEKIILVAGLILCSMCFSRVLLNGAVTSRHLVWSIVTLCLILSIGYRAYKRRELYVPSPQIFIVMLCFLVISALSLFGAVNKAEGIYQICVIFNMACYLFVVAVVLKDDKDFVIKASVLIAFVLAVYGIYQCATIADPVERKGTMGFKNLWASAHALLIPMCVYSIFKYKKWWRMAGLVSALLLVVNIFLPPLTRSVFLGLIAASVAMTLFKPKLLIVVVVCVILAGSVCLITNNTKYIEMAMDGGSMQERLGVWQATLEMIGDNLVRGVGSGNWLLASPLYLNGNMGWDWAYTILHFLSPHNDFLKAYAETGLIGGSLYASIFLLALYYAWRTGCMMAFAGIVIYVVYAIFSFPGRRVFHPVILLIYIGIVLVGMPGSQIRLSGKVLAVGFVVVSFMSFVVFDYYERHKTNSYISRITEKKAIGDYKGVIDEFENYTWFSQLGPLGEPVLIYGAEACLMTGDLNMATRSYLAARKVSPYHYNTLNNLAGCFAISGREEEARAIFAGMLKCWPDNERIHKNIKVVNQKRVQNE